MTTGQPDPANASTPARKTTARKTTAGMPPAVGSTSPHTEPMGFQCARCEGNFPGDEPVAALRRGQGGVLIGLSCYDCLTDPEMVDALCGEDVVVSAFGDTTTE